MAWFGESRMWRLESLEDFARVSRWLEAGRAAGQAREVVWRYFQAAGPVLRASVGEYISCVEELDELAGGIFSAPPSAHNRNHAAAGPGSASPLDKLRLVGAQLREFFDSLDQSGWLGIIESRAKYFQLLRKLVAQFGSFETLVPMLPPIGPVITDPQVQQHLGCMYAINTRNIRRLELIYDTCRTWRKNHSSQPAGFIDPKTYCNKLMSDIVLEYMIEADPIRIQARRDKARKTGKPFTPYRFWRPAEDFRLMSKVQYSDDASRKPSATRKYVDLQLDYVPPICTDLRRLQWSIRELFNNALAATSRMYAAGPGKWSVQPLHRHDVPDPAPAVVVSLVETARRGWLRQKPTLKMVLRDEGTGIPREHRPYVLLWGYSPRRAEFLQFANCSKEFRSRLGQEINIGGKGIGLAYAATVIREHGGDIEIRSTHHQGTTVTVHLPIPTAVSI